ncbi:hypothetical protein PBY51_022176 [Eleginops maclovinus]|uniref:Uncharacterized protein n=1 Tax=Eleginops maclovinus TaxID=56733 RepID=A0AAN7XH27_ELEMC|nr:hypothetical protein PBY51_022176 [Eleginops maclovinus]
MESINDNIIQSDRRCHFLLPLLHPLYGAAPSSLARCVGNYLIIPAERCQGLRCISTVYRGKVGLSVQAQQNELQLDLEDDQEEKRLQQTDAAGGERTHSAEDTH